MASSSVRPPSLEPDTSSEVELDEPLSQQQTAKRSVWNLRHFLDFATALRNSLQELIVKKHYGHYDSVHVLFLAWGVPASSTTKELKDLEYFLRTHLKFTTQYHQIVCNDAANEFDSMLEDVVRAYAGANELLIIYYAGHSRLYVAEKTTTWQATREPASSPVLVFLESASAPVHVLPELNWSTIENRLNQTSAKHSNILYILDSGYTPSMCPPSPQGSKELLAASKDVPKSTAVGDYLFTADLLHELRQQIQATDSISVSTLHSRIIKRQAERQIPKPYHLPLSAKASSSSIVLASMTEDNPCIPTRLRESQSVTLCMIQVKISARGTPVEWWKEYIDHSATTEKLGVKVHPGDYVKHLACDIVGEAHVILVSMPSEVSRKIVEKTSGRAFTELKTVNSEAALTKDMLHEAWRKARVPTASLPRRFLGDQFFLPL